MMRKIFKIIFVFIFSLSFIFSNKSPFFLKKAEASTPTHLVINEVFYDTPGVDAEEEWIEIYNPSPETIDLSEYKLGDAQFSGSNEGMYAFPSGSQIEPKGFIVVALKAQGFYNLYGFEPDFEINESDGQLANNMIKYSNWATGSLALSNTGDEVLLLNKDDEIVDVVNWGNSSFRANPHPGVASGHSLERKVAGFDTDNCAEDFVDQFPPTPGEGKENFLPDCEAGPDRVVKVKEVVSFDGSSSTDLDGVIISYEWDFGDGQTAEGVVVSHSFERVGRYQVSLKVTDDYGDSAVDELTVTVFEDSSSILINELLPDPAPPLLDAQDEWVELYNASSREVDLSFWLLKDRVGSIKEYALPWGTKISPFGYLLFKSSETGLSLNNDGDGLQLLTPDGVVKDSSSLYSSSKEGQAFARRLDGSWVWTNLPTPLGPNMFSDLEIKGSDLVLISIREAREQTKGSLVRIQGRVIVEPGRLGRQIFYLEDSTSGIQIYCYEANFPPLKLGDFVEVVGQLDEYYREKRIKIDQSSSIAILAHQAPPKPLLIKTGQVGEFYEGRLVKVKGRLIKSSGDTFYLDDGSGQVKIYLKASTGIKKPPLKRGDLIEVIGIVSQTSTGYRILPRFTSDIKVLKPDQTNSPTSFGSPSVAEAASPLDNFSQEASKATPRFSWLEILGWVIIGLGLIGLGALRFYDKFTLNRQD